MTLKDKKTERQRRHHHHRSQRQSSFLSFLIFFFFFFPRFRRFFCFRVSLRAAFRALAFRLEAAASASPSTRCPPPSSLDPRNEPALSRRHRTIAACPLPVHRRLAVAAALRRVAQSTPTERVFASPSIRAFPLRSHTIDDAAAAPATQFGRVRRHASPFRRHSTSPIRSRPRVWLARALKFWPLSSPPPRASTSAAGAARTEILFSTRTWTSLRR